MLYLNHLIFDIWSELIFRAAITYFTLHLVQVSAIVSCLLGPDRAEQITIFAGDVVPRKKPDPVRVVCSWVLCYAAKYSLVCQGNLYWFSNICCLIAKKNFSRTVTSENRTNQVLLKSYSDAKLTIS